MLADHNDNNKIDIDFIKNKHGFTNRHIDVIACLTRGKFSNKTIAQVLNVSPKTVDSHIQMVMQKLDINIREKIIEFMQISGYEEVLEKHYHHLTGIPWQSTKNTLAQDKIARANKNKNKFVFIFVIFIGLIMVVSAKRLNNRSKMFFHNIALHPNDQCFLERHQIIQKMHDSLVKQKKSVKIIAISGIGGAGKTTLARQYTKQYPASIVWEINTETPETMTTSFFELANQLAQNQKDKEILIYIKNINNQKEQDVQIFRFVKTKLRSHKNWLLIYDNVNSSTQIPFHDDCGNGVIILTTRDANLSATNDIITVDALNDEEMYELLKKITPILPHQKKEAVAFLKNIPPFPLDVATAAFYIKATKITYPNFIKHMKEHDPTFENTVLKVRQSMNNYVHTRHGLLALKFRSLAKEHPEFKELLLALALFDSQRIPRAFLNHYKKSAVVDLFVHALQKYSLITACDSNSISLHRSTQEHLVRFLTEELKDIQTHTDVLMSSFKKYLNIPIQNIDTDTLRFFIPHLLACLKHDKLLTSQSQLILKLLLGQIYFNFSDYKETKKYLDTALTLSSSSYVSIKLKAELFSYLGALYNSLSNYPPAQQYCKEALSLYKQINDHQSIEKAFLLVAMGHNYMYLGNYTLALKNILEGINLYKNHLSSYHPRLAMSYMLLGNVYEWQVNYLLAIKNYKMAYTIFNKIYGPTHTTTIWTQRNLGRVLTNIGEYKKAIQLLTTCENAYNHHLSYAKDQKASCVIYLGTAYLNSGMDHLAKKTILEGCNIQKERNNPLQIGWGKIYLAQVELNNKQYQKAIELLQDSLKAHLLTYPDENQIRWFSLIYYHLANAYKLSGQNILAKEAYEKSLRIGQKHYGEHHMDTALIMTDYGDFEKNETMLNEALNTLQKNNHPQAYKCLEYLGDLRMTQSKPKEAKSYYKKALEIAKANFPKGSDHTKRLQKKLNLSF